MLAVSTSAETSVPIKITSLKLQVIGSGMEVVATTDALLAGTNCSNSVRFNYIKNNPAEAYYAALMTAYVAGHTVQLTYYVGPSVCYLRGVKLNVASN